MFRFSILFAVWMLAVMPARAEVPQDIQELVQALAIPEIIQVMRQEGLDFGDELAEDMFPGRGGDKWHALLDSIYDADRMREITVAGFAEALEGADTEDLTAFSKPAGPADHRSWVRFLMRRKYCSANGTVFRMQETDQSLRVTRISILHSETGTL